MNLKRLFLTALICAPCCSAVAAKAGQAGQAARAALIPAGLFDSNLMIATNDLTQKITGYMNDGSCRFIFSGQNNEAASRYRGDTFYFTAWRPEDPSHTLGFEVFSIAKGGFYNQITFLSDRDSAASVLPGCRTRLSLDRANSMGYSVIGVRVVKVNQISFFAFLKNGASKEAFMPFKIKTNLKRNDGVWLEKEWGPSYKVPHFVLVTWYEASGEGHQAYVRERDLYPENPPSDELLGSQNEH